MNVGWIGLGKLGLPCALSLAHYAGHTVTGYDINRDAVVDRMKDPTDRGETGLGQLLDEATISLADSPADVVAASDVVFVAVQTPHAPEYGGETPAPAERRDFEYAYLVDACRAVCKAAAEQRKPVTLVVVSTVLPGTCGRLIRPLLNSFVTLVYSPLFIAMGTTIADFLRPEFVLTGADDPTHVEPVRDVYAYLHDQGLAVMSIESAELTKVAYNTFISVKIVWANALMEICHKTGADCDRVVDALEKATDRVVSARYMRGGMGDGGACHPRDLIAMSWLAQRLDLSYDLLGEMAKAREVQTQWLADLACQWSAQASLPIVILGKAYKPGSPLTYGSPALLLRRQLREPGSVLDYVQVWDPFVDDTKPPTEKPAVFVIGTAHRQFRSLAFPAGSVVIDPHGYIPDQPGVTVVRVGRKN